MDRIETAGPGEGGINHPRKRLLWPRRARYRAIEQHYVYLAHMLAAHGIDADCLTSQQLQALELANHLCAPCSSRKRCRTWLEWDRPKRRPQAFCPNARLFATIAADEAADRQSAVVAKPFVLEQASRTLTIGSG